MSTHNICFHGEMRKVTFFYLSLFLELCMNKRAKFGADLSFHRVWKIASFSLWIEGTLPSVFGA